MITCRPFLITSIVVSLPCTLQSYSISNLISNKCIDHESLYAGSCSAKKLALLALDEAPDVISVEQNPAPQAQVQPILDKRPHEQRVKSPRKARRMNHSFMHLYRHDSSLFDDQKIALNSKSLTSARTYLREYGGFTDDEINEMSKSFPPLLDLDVKR